MIKDSVGREAFISTHKAQDTNITKGQELRTGTLDAETEAEGMEETSLLACVSFLSQFVFFYTPGPPAQAWCHPQWARASHNNHLSRKCPQGLAYGPI